MFVLDASVTLAWCFEDEADEYTIWALQRCREDHVRVPAIWPVEVSNVLLVAERRQRISPVDSTRFLTLLAGLPIQVDMPTWPVALESLLDLARRHGLSAYDGSYLAHALREHIPLVTKDEKLRRAARNEGIPVLNRLT